MRMQVLATEYLRPDSLHDAGLEPVHEAMNCRVQSCLERGMGVC